MKKPDATAVIREALLKRLRFDGSPVPVVTRQFVEGGETTWRLANGTAIRLVWKATGRLAHRFDFTSPSEPILYVEVPASVASWEELLPHIKALTPALAAELRAHEARLAPRARKESVRPRRLAGVVVPPLNFTVRPSACTGARMTSFGNFLRRVLIGEAPLWQAFWLVGVGGLTLLSLFSYLILRAVFGPEPSLRVLFFAGMLPNSAAVAYVCVGIWNCAPNTVHRAFRTLARICAYGYAAAWLRQVVHVMANLWMV